MTDNNEKNIPELFSNNTIIQHYRIIKKIGSGGMGVVYLAEDTKLDRQVALKFLTLNQKENSPELIQFRKEAQAAARLQHPNIITVYEVNEYKNCPYISMEFIEGQSLQEILGSRAYSINEIIEIAIQISSGLAEAHEKGITHQDLKPGNLMVDQTGTIKILDFGLALLSEKKSNPDSERTITSNPFADKITGTILYMAPEQLLGQESNNQIDIFAFGIILYELITGEHPFTAPTVSELTAKILRDTPNNLYDKRNDVPYDLNRIVFRCLNKKSTKRFQTARDICNELEELLNLLKQNITVNVSSKGVVKTTTTLTEESYVLTTELVRELTLKDPRMIGTKLAYMDNNVVSDKLVVYLHGIGADHRQFSDALRKLPYRAVAISLYGFDENAQLRIPLKLEDHSILLHALIKDISDRLKPKINILVGFSSGADHFLHCLTSELFDDIKISGMLSLGCNIHIEDCFATSKLSELTSGDENQILSIIKLFSQHASSISDWLILHSYLVTAFSKFSDQTKPFSQYAYDILKPFKDGNWELFPKWYQNCMKKIPHVRFITDTGGYNTLDTLMLKHLENNILGDDFSEDSIMKVPDSHMDLVKPEKIVAQTIDFMKLFS